ncbi:hypothetical protein [Aquihabitans sp. McL0605]|uniref:hypothetical protein n=1 Tax=Aquihabitans sp. McL0605 TaxID=3415671 RepID=UPI003CEB6D55
MSPVDQSRNHVGRAAAVALVGVFVLTVALLLVTFAIGGKKSADVKLGDQTFQGGSTTRLAKEIDERGPIFYGDVSGRKDRDIILQHLGDDPQTGWYAFLAAPIDKSRACTWQWQADEEQFRAKCDKTLTAPADGKGLPQFKVTVNDGRLDVNLNADAKTTTTTTDATTTDATTSTTGG